MAKITSTRMPDVGKVIQALAVKGIGDLEDFLIFVQDFANQVISALNKTLTIEQNLDSEIRVLNLIHGVPQKIIFTDPQKVPKLVWVGKTIPFQNPALSLAWQIAIDGSLEVTATFVGAPAAAVQTSLVILF